MCVMNDKLNIDMEHLRCSDDSALPAVGLEKQTSEVKLIREATQWRFLENSTVDIAMCWKCQLSL
jgi:hypothetical protein